MRVGLGTGTTVAELVPVLGRRRPAITCVGHVARRPKSWRWLTASTCEPFTDIDRLDIAIDGADQVDPGRLAGQGRGGAHTRERIVAAAADRFVVIVSSDKPVDAAPCRPSPLELLAFGLAATLHALPGAALRDAPPTPDGGVLADFHGDVADPAPLAEWLDAVPGVVSHGLFPPSMVSTVLVARGERGRGAQIA